MSPLLCPPPMEKEDDEGSKGMSSVLKANFETLKKRKLNGAAAHRVAEETAYLVETEIQNLRNSVAELEALLSAKQDAYDDDDDDDDQFENAGENNGNEILEKNQFPLLPPNVVAIPLGDDADTESDGDLDDDFYADFADEAKELKRV